MWCVPALRALAAALALETAMACADDVEVRLRFAWGSGAQAPMTWSGSIVVDGAQLSDLRPLGVEADEAAAIQLRENSVVVKPIVPRAFDGCDVTVRGAPSAALTIRLTAAPTAEAKVATFELSQLASETFRVPLDALGGYLLVQRAPGDRLRVTTEHDHFVFAPGDPVRLAVTPDLNAELAAGPITLEARLQRIGAAGVLWQSTTPLAHNRQEPVAIELPAPAEEGAYRLSLAAVRPVGFAGKLVPWEQPNAVALRDVEFVVIDPKARLARLTNRWEAVQTIDPTSPKWWQRVPQWTQLDRLPGLTSPRSWGNVRPAGAGDGLQGVVELPAPAAGGEPTWQAFSLSIAQVGAPHAVEIDVPAGFRQHLTVSIIEPDAAGRAQAFGRDAGLCLDGQTTPIESGPSTPQRVVFWPRTASPVLLVVNQSTSRPARFGAIRVLLRVAEPVNNLSGETAPSVGTAGERIVAAFVGAPRLADCLGSSKTLDGGGLSVDNWQTFLDAGNRLAQQVAAEGYNAAVVSIAADGASLAAIDAVGASPRYDTGSLASSGADLRRKDVLEALLRIFDREGLRLIPAIDLSAPLPALEALRRDGESRYTGVELVGADGRTWSETFPGEAAGAHYNILAPQVQSALAQAVEDVVNRYGRHPSLAGVALSVTGRGYGALPGVAWGLDDATMARFAQDAGVDLAVDGDGRFQARARAVVGPHAEAWRTWRQAQVTQLYAEMARRIAATRDDLQLVLCTQHLFSGRGVQQDLRLAVSGRASLEAAAANLGIDFAALAAAPGVCVLRPRRLSAEEGLRGGALDLALYGAAEIDAALAPQPRAGEHLYHASRRLRLESFDAVSPFGAERTFLACNVPAFAGGDAARRMMTTALAGRDCFTLVEGADVVPLVADDRLAQMRRVFAQLPGAEAEVRVERHQPLALRVYRTASATTVCVLNASPWPTSAELPLEAAEATAWRALGTDPSSSDLADAAGVWPTTGQSWRLALPPYSMAARRFESRNLRVGAMAVEPSEEAGAALAARIVELERLMRSLDVERPYQQLQNPDFELVEADGRMVGWQPRIGKLGLAAIDGGVAQQGDRALRLRSEDALGVAVQSHLFPIPATGQLVVRAQVRGDEASKATLYAWVEFDGGAGSQLLHAPLVAGPFHSRWQACEASFDDLPLGSAGQMRVQFHLAGPGEAWIDRIELFDLRFSEERRLKLARQLYAARTFLDGGQLTDCQRVLDGYWPRYLAEFLPAAPRLAPVDVGPTPQISVASRPDAAGSAPGNQQDDDSGGFGGRVRDVLPRVFRR